MKIKKLTVLILSIIMLSFICYYFQIKENGFIIIPIFIGVFYFFKHNIYKFYNSTKRKKVIIGIISILFSITELICISINKDYTLNNVMDKWLLLKTCGFFITEYAIVLFIYDFLENFKFNNKKAKRINNILSKIKSEKKLVIVCTILIIIFWLPYFIAYYPGIISSDSYSQIQQVMGDIPLNNHHPIFHTSLIALFIKIGTIIFNNLNNAVALYTMFQMIVMAMLFSYVIKFLRENNVPIFFRIIVLLYYMLHPIIATYSVIMWKDILFAGILPVFTIYCFKILIYTDDFLQNKKNIFMFIIISLCTINIRHNGYYIAIITFFIFTIALKKYWKKVVPIFAIIIILNNGINFYIFNVINVKKGAIGEALSIPIQQIARTIKNNENVDENIKNMVNKFFKEENIWEKYIPTNSDPIKFRFNNEYFEDNKHDFIEIWIKLFIKYPIDYIEATISNSYGYYYIGADNNVLEIYDNFQNDYNINLNPTEDNTFYNFLKMLVYSKKIPIISMLFKIGTAFWIIIILIGYSIYKRRYIHLYIYIPSIILWLTCIASPVYNEFRYAYPLVTTLPVYISLNYMQYKEKLEENNFKKI